MSGARSVYNPCEYPAMVTRSVYLAKHRAIAAQRAHFALFIPNKECDRASIREDFKLCPTSGTRIHVVGEPAMVGYVFEIKRNFECSESFDLKELVLLGTVNADNIYDPTSSDQVTESTPRCVIERHIKKIDPPPKGQDIRAPIDGVHTKRCQEWTKEVLELLAGRNLIQQEAVSIVEEQRDPPKHGIYGYKVE